MIDLRYEIVRSPKRKTLTITVERDRTVVVYAPEGTSDQDVQRIVDVKRQWILGKVKHPQKYQQREHPPGKELVSGESALYLGRDYRIEIAATESGQIEFGHVFLIPPAQLAKRREVLRDWYRSRAKETILSRVQQHARALGVKPERTRIVSNRYSWGSCTVNNNVSLNWRLIKAPIFVIDYVVIHELAHLIESNHTPRFWSIVRAHTATTEKARSWLKEHGQILEQEV
jgi:predicted metal-dependent hydrolase